MASVFIDLLEGRLPATYESALLVGHGGDWYLKEPPEIVVRRRLLDASAATADGALEAALAGALPGQAAAVAVKPLSSPGLAAVRTQPGGSEATIAGRLLVSGIGGFMTVILDWPGGTDIPIIAAHRPDIRYWLRHLGWKGWRYVPARLLDRPYDGPRLPASSPVRWMDAIFGESASSLDG
ncbi:MAG: hypothetical protein ACRD1K_17975 [Acidimicrobiales bacterium]